MPCGGCPDVGAFQVPAIRRGAPPTGNWHSTWRGRCLLQDALMFMVLLSEFLVSQQAPKVDRAGG